MRLLVNETQQLSFWGCRPEDANLGVIRIDGIIRKNAGVSLGDRVTIKKVETKECERLVLSPVMAKQQKVKFGSGNEGFARRGLKKRLSLQATEFLFQE
ncbi:MAG: hypothetical protein Ct9H90mP16_10890 [Candidatus Poseidoniales archaeon]|nr:MAG: hypothetical protein Ct9H90mP16_10890 [Candidatus Poseidoniales archaeon]